MAKDTQREMDDEVKSGTSTFTKITAAFFESPLTQWLFHNQELLVASAGKALKTTTSLLFSVWKQGEVPRS